MNDAASDAIARIAGRVGFHVVGFCVDHECCAAIAEKRVSVIAEVYVLVGEADFCFSVGAHGEVGHVAGMVAIGTVEAVLLAVRIEMRACGLKVRRIAFRDLMEVNRVLARRQIFEVEVQADSASLVFIQDDGAHTFALGIRHVNRGFRGNRERESDDAKRQSYGQYFVEFHARIIDLTLLRGKIFRCGGSSP
jgi:hypothetical protein